MAQQTKAQTQLEGYRRSMVRLSLLADGQHQKLDQILDELRQVLRQPEADPEQVQDALQRAEDGHESMLAGQQNEREQLVEVLRTMNRQLREQASEESTDLDQLGHGLELRARDLGELVLYLREYSALQQDVYAGVSQLQTAAPMLAAAEQALTVGHSRGSKSDLQQMRDDVFSAVTSLANRIQMPAEKQQSLQAIVQGLERSISWAELMGLLHQLIELVVLVLSDEQHALEEYLGQLNERLTLIRSAVQRAQSIRNDFAENGQRLDARIQGHVDSIRREMSQATNLNQLKDGIQSELDDIVSSIDDFLRDSAEKERNMATMMTELVDIISDLEEQNQQIREDFERTRQQALTDQLTGLPNRSAYMKSLATEYERFKRYNTPLTLCVLDVDYFKSVNDELGHTAGDKVLKILARELRRLLRETDFIGRHGGEEFVILLPATGLSDALSAMEKLRQRIEVAPFHFRSKPVPITVSIGCAEFGPGETPEVVFDRADHAMYSAKEKGRNRVES